MRPAAQSLHVLELEPASSMNLPAAHLTRTVAPWADMVFPRGHAEHDVCSEAPLKRPTSQSSHSLLRPKVFENRPGGHLLHFASALTPCAEEYVPRGHWVQGTSWFKPETLLYRPGVHGSQTVLAEFAHLPAEHAEQLLPGTVLAWPSGQATHTRAPRVPDICLPASHTRQKVKPGPSAK